MEMKKINSGKLRAIGYDARGITAVEDGAGNLILKNPTCPIARPAQE